MFIFIKKMFITLLSFGGSVATKYVSLNNQRCQIRPTLTNVNLINLFVIHLLLLSISAMEVVTLLLIHMLKYKL